MATTNYPWYESYFLITFPNGFETEAEDTTHTVSLPPYNSCQITSLNHYVHLYGRFIIPFKVYAIKDNSLLYSNTLDIYGEGTGFDVSEPKWMANVDYAILFSIIHSDADVEGVRVEFEEGYYSPDPEDRDITSAIVGFNLGNHPETGNPMASGGKTLNFYFAHEDEGIKVYTKESGYTEYGILYVKTENGYVKAKSFDKLK